MTGSLWNYYRDQPSDPLSTNSESFKYKTSITGNIYNVNLTIIGDGGNPIPNPNYDENKVDKNETEVVIPLKHLSNFWRTLVTLLINCEVELILTWSKNCALADMTVRAAENNKDCSTNWIRVSNNRCKIICTSCYFIKGKSYKASRAIRDRIKKSYKMEQIQITNVYSE